MTKRSAWSAFQIKRHSGAGSKTRRVQHNRYQFFVLLARPDKTVWEKGTVPTMGHADAWPTVPGSEDSAKLGQSPPVLPAGF
jgi:hypothetical protein